MPKEKERTLKEKYSLWFEYFQRSKGYKRLFKRFPTRDEFESEKSKINLTISSPYLKVINEPALKTYQFFADAIYESFDYWWEKHFPEGEINIEEVTEEWYEGKDLKYLPDMVISIRDLWDLEKLVKEFRKIIAIGKRELKTPGRERFKLLLRLKNGERKRQIKKWLYPSAPFRFKEVKNYLDLFDKITFFKKRGMIWDEILRKMNPELMRSLDDYNKPQKKKMTWDEIIRAESSDENISEEDQNGKVASYERLLKLHYSKAKKIIRNSEIGIFPGPY